MSFVLYRLLLASLEIAVLTLFGVLAFGVAIQGSVAAMALVALLGVTAFSGISMMVASRAQNSETASGLMNLATMPMMVLSGVFFSYEKFPTWTLPAIRLLPLTALNDAMRAIINEGATLASQASQVGVLTVWSVVGFAVALKFFRWQ
jgi:ABC-type multidrug transport system permease subunit